MAAFESFVVEPMLPELEGRFPGLDTENSERGENNGLVDPDGDSGGDGDWMVAENGMSNIGKSGHVV